MLCQTFENNRQVVACKPRGIMRCPDMHYGALRRVRIQRGNAKNIFVLPFPYSDEMRSTLAAKMADLTR